MVVFVFFFFFWGGGGGGGRGVGAAGGGISYPDLCEKIIEISLAKYPEEKSDF